MRRTGVKVALFATTLSWAAPGRAEGCADRFSPERPGATNGHSTVLPGCAQIETGVAVERAPSTTAVSFPTLFRVGLVDVVELRALTGIVGVEVPDAGDADASPTSSGLEVKITGLRAKGRAPGVGALFGVSSVTSSDFTRELTPTTSLLFDWQLADGFWLSANGIGSIPPATTAARVLQLSYAAVLWYDLLGWMSVYGNAFGGAPVQDGSFSQWAGGGLAFYPPIDAFQLDLSVDAEATGDDHPVLMQAGVAFAF